jgi:hypothetical protein
VRILKVKNLVLKKKREYKREKRDIHKELYIDGRVLSPYKTCRTPDVL